MIPTMPVIVTSFFDIGRGTWESPNLPGYLKRTTDEYFHRFERLLSLDNDIIVYAESKFKDKFISYQQQKPNLMVEYVDNWRDIWNEFRPRIANVFHDKSFYMNIQQPWNPEYWSTDYLMINFLKSYFVCNAIDTGRFDKDSMFAWIDFGYAREPYHVPTDCWNYNFDPNKIHFFTTKQYVPTHTDIKRLIDSNDVFIMGCHIIASKDNWKTLNKRIYDCIDILLHNRMIDDDQTLLYMCYIKNPDEFQIHHIDTSDWFVVFRDFNNDV